MEVRKVRYFSKAYRDVGKLYRQAFPFNERMPVWLLRATAYEETTELLAFYDDGKFLGLAHLTQEEDTVFVIFLAVNPELRGQGNGSRILDFLKDTYAGQELYLCIEPLDESAKNYAQRVSRLRFYERNGFHLSGYRVFDPSGQYELLSTAVAINVTGMELILKKGSFGPFHCTMEKE